MRILTVRQPWAWAIVHGQKDVENRSRNLVGDYRGPVAIHAGLRADFNTESEPLDIARNLWFGVDHEMWDPDESHWPWFDGRGAIIGVVDLVDVHHEGDCWTSGEDRGSETEWSMCSPWAQEDAWHLVLTNPRPLPEPIPFKGGLGLRRLDDATTAAVLRGLS